MRREFLKPDLVVVKETLLRIVYEHRRGYVHSIYETQPLLDIAFVHKTSHGAGNIHETATVRHFKPQMFGEALHIDLMPDHLPSWQGRVPSKWRLVMQPAHYRPACVAMLFCDRQVRIPRAKYLRSHKESLDRLMTALINSGSAFTVRPTTINLAPDDMKKEGPSFDLPIVVWDGGRQRTDGSQATRQLCAGRRAGTNRSGSAGQGCAALPCSRTRRGNRQDTLYGSDSTCWESTSARFAFSAAQVRSTSAHYVDIRAIHKPSANTSAKRGLICSYK